MSACCRATTPSHGAQLLLARHIALGRALWLPALDHRVDRVSPDPATRLGACRLRRVVVGPVPPRQHPPCSTPCAARSLRQRRRSPRAPGRGGCTVRQLPHAAQRRRPAPVTRRPCARDDGLDRGGVPSARGVGPRRGARVGHLRFSGPRLARRPFSGDDGRLAERLRPDRGAQLGVAAHGHGLGRRGATGARFDGGARGLLFGAVGLAETLVVVGCLVVGAAGAYRLAAGHVGGRAGRGHGRDRVRLRSRRATRSRMDASDRWSCMRSSRTSCCCSCARVGSRDGRLRRAVRSSVSRSAPGSSLPGTRPPRSWSSWSPSCSWWRRSSRADSSVRCARSVRRSSASSARRSCSFHGWSRSRTHATISASLGIAYHSNLDLSEVLRFQSGPAGAGIAPWGLLAAALIALLVARGDRLSWAIRAVALVVVGDAVVFVPEHISERTAVAAPEAGLAIAALGVAWAAAIAVNELSRSAEVEAFATSAARARRSEHVAEDVDVWTVRCTPRPGRGGSRGRRARRLGIPRRHHQRPMGCPGRQLGRCPLVHPGPARRPVPHPVDRRPRCAATRPRAARRRGLVGARRETGPAMRASSGARRSPAPTG